jgi:hypothetical protein
MSNGELHIEIDWGGEDKTGITLICGGCRHVIDIYASENMFCVPVRIQRNCPKCGTRFSRIAGRMK